MWQLDLGKTRRRQNNAFEIGTDGQRNTFFLRFCHYHLWYIPHMKYVVFFQTMPSKLKQTDKGTPLSPDFPTIIFDTFLTWIIPCVFPNNAYKIGTDGQRETFFSSYWIYDIVLNQGHLKKRKKGYSISLSQDRIQFKRLAFPNQCLPNKNKEMGNIAIGSFFRAPLSKQN